MTAVKAALVLGLLVVCATISLTLLGFLVQATGYHVEPNTSPSPSESTLPASKPTPTLSPTLDGAGGSRPAERVYNAP